MACDKVPFLSQETTPSFESVASAVIAGREEAAAALVLRLHRSTSLVDSAFPLFNVSLGIAVPEAIAPSRGCSAPLVVIFDSFVTAFSLPDAPFYQNRSTSSFDLLEFLVYHWPSSFRIFSLLDLLSPYVPSTQCTTHAYALSTSSFPDVLFVFPLSFHRLVSLCVRLSLYHPRTTAASKGAALQLATPQPSAAKPAAVAVEQTSAASAVEQAAAAAAAAVEPAVAAEGAAAAAVEEIAAAAEETAAAVKDTAAVVEDTAGTVEKAAAAVEETVAAVKETVAAGEETVAAGEETVAAREETVASLQAGGVEDAAVGTAVAAGELSCRRKRRLTSVFLFRLLLEFIFIGFLSLFSRGEAKKVLGLARDDKYQSIAEFCFTIPPGEHGSIVAQTVVNSPGHELVILNRTEHKLLQLEEEEGGLSSFPLKKEEQSVASSQKEETQQQQSSGAASAVAAAREQLLCETLLRNARVREPLHGGVPLQFQSDLPSLFELDLVVDPKLDKQPITAWLTRCQSKLPLDAMYSIQLLNPGGLWTRHFSCNEQGLLQLYLLLLTCCCLGAAMWWGAAWRRDIFGASLSPQPQQQTSSRPSADAAANGRHVSIAACSSSACALFSLSVLLYTLHLLAYASNGFGVIVFKFLSQFFEASTRVLLCCIFAALAAAEGKPTAFSAAAARPATRLSLHAASRTSLAPAAVGGYILLQFFDVMAEYSLPTAAHVSAYSLFRTGWGLPSVLGSAVIAGLLIIENSRDVVTAAAAASLRHHDEANLLLLRRRLLLAAATTLYFLVPLLLLLFFPPSPVWDSCIMLARELTAAAVLFRVTNRGGDSNFGVWEDKTAVEAHPYSDL